MPEYVVIEHKLDDAAKVYRLVVGVLVEDPDAEEGAEAVIVGVEDFLFHSEDERWAGKDIELIAAEQRDIARAALREREQETEKRSRRKKPVAMPGEGNSL